MTFASAVGSREGEGPLKNRFDYIDTDDRFGMKTWEMAESESARLALSLAFACIFATLYAPKPNAAAHTTDKDAI